MALFDQLGGKEWVQSLGLRLDGPPAKNEVRLVLPDHKKANRIGVVSRLVNGTSMYTASWWKVNEEGDEAEPVKEAEAESAAEVAGLIAADVRKMAVR